MLSQKLRRAVAGLGVFSIAGLGVFSALPAQGASSTDSYKTDPSAVTIGKTLVSNDTIIEGYGGGAEFLFEVTPSACSDNGCVSQGYIPTINDVSVTARPNVKVNSASFLPAAEVYTKAGIYQWTVKEKSQISDSGSGYRSSIAFSKAEYTIRAAVKEESGSRIYNWITITKNKNDDGSSAGDVKVENLDFVNVAHDLGHFEIVKKVENNSGITEVGPYNMRVDIELPGNYDGAADDNDGNDWTTDTPTVRFDSTAENQATNTSCNNTITSQVNGKAVVTLSCYFTLDKDKKTRIVNVPVGSRYTVTELSTSDEYSTTYTNKTGVIPIPQWAGSAPAGFDLSEIDTEEKCNNLPNQYSEITSVLWDEDMGFCFPEFAPAGPAPVLATVTNKYKDITPTGIILEYMPYVLMVIIPLAGIGAYVAMRRKLLS